MRFTTYIHTYSYQVRERLIFRVGLLLHHRHLLQHLLLHVDLAAAAAVLEAVRRVGAQLLELGIADLRDGCEGKVWTIIETRSLGIGVGE